MPSGVLQPAQRVVHVHLPDLSAAGLPSRRDNCAGNGGERPQDPRAPEEPHEIEAGSVLQ
eukprot:1476319-Amphidinium_carterae.2